MKSCAATSGSYPWPRHSGLAAAQSDGVSVRLTVNTRLVVVLCTAASVAVVLSVQPGPSAAIDEQVPPSSFVVTNSGPAVVRPPTDPFLFTITIKYVGPPRTSSIATRFSDRFPVAVVLTPPVFRAATEWALATAATHTGRPSRTARPERSRSIARS